MSIDLFIQDIVNRLSEKLGDGFVVVPKTVMKNNSVEAEGIMIRSESESVAPCIYMNELFLEYKNGRSPDSVAEEVIRIFNQSSSVRHASDICSLLETEGLEEKVVARLVNYEKNVRLLSELVYDRVLDLAVTYHLVLKRDGDSLMTTRIKKDNCELFGLTPDKIRKNALKNTERMFPPVFEKLETMLKRILEAKNAFPFSPDGEAYAREDMHPQLYVLTTRGGENGASSILYKGLLERVKSALGSDFYIIPSSVNEVLIVPDDGVIDREAMENMVKEVNRDYVSEQEVLSDRIYHFPEDGFVLEYFSNI